MMKEEFAYKYDELMNPLLDVMKALGGSGSIEEQEEGVATLLNLTDTQINEIHKGNTSKFSYRLAWARHYLKRYGILENSSRGIWALTEKGLKSKSVDKDAIKKQIAAEDRLRIKGKDKASEQSEANMDDEDITQTGWKEIMIESLKKMDPGAFERLCQRLLRELGFINVEVTGKVNDGGIDGKGILRLGGVLSFHVIFQAKRYKETVPSSTVRDFRGALIGRADKGLIITTGRFTMEAKKEASREGAIQIDLVDGNELVDKLKEMKLGVEIELVEKVTVKQDWFNTI